MLDMDNDNNSDSSVGLLDGTAVDFHYAIERDRLEYVLDGECADEPKFFSVQDIVGVFAIKHDRHNSKEHSLLHVSNSSSSDSYGTLESTAVKNLPKSFIKNFSVSLTARAEERASTLLHVLISVGSGKQRAEECFTSLVDPLLAHLKSSTSVDCTIVRTSSATTISNYTMEKVLPQAIDGREQTILLLSGDGGIVDIINALALRSSSTLTFKKPVVALIPLGTANALAHSLNVANDNTMGLSAWFRGVSKPLPTFAAKVSAKAQLVTDEGTSTESLPEDSSGEVVIYGSVVCSWGLHASLVADSDNKEYRKLGSSRFEKAANALLHPPNGAGPHRYKAKVSTLKLDEFGNATWKTMPEDEHVYVLVTLVSNLESTFKISPNTKPLDGRLHLVYINASSGDEIMRVMNLAYENGKHVDDPNVLYEEVDGLKIEFDGREICDRWRRVCIDGKIVVLEANGWIEIVNNSRPVIEITIPRK